MLHPDPAKSFTTRTAFRSFLLAAASVSAPIAGAATLYWDGTSTGANADGGAGTWDATTLNWDSLATAGLDSAWVDGSDASFAGTGATVTVSGSFSLNSLTIGSGYTLTGGTLTLGGKTITTSGVGSSTDAFINSVLAGTGGITIAANGDTSASGGGVGGSLRLGGTNTFTGGLTITSGVVNMDSNFGDASNVITLNGGGLVDENTSTTLTRSIVIGSSGGVMRTWGSVNGTYTGGISGTGTLRRTDGGTQTYTGNFTGSVGFNNQGGTTTLRGNWLSSGTLTASGGNLYVRGQVYDGAAVVNSGGYLLLASINRNSVQLSTSSGSIGLGRASALGVGSTYNIASGTYIGASTGAWLDSSKFAAGYNLQFGSITSAPLYGSTNLNANGGLAGVHTLYTGTLTTTANTVTSDQGFFAPNATFSLGSGTRLDIWAGSLVVGALTGSGNITANGPGRTDTGLIGNFPLPTYNGSASQNKSVAQVGRLATSAIIVGSNNASTTYSGQIQAGSWSSAAPSLLKRGTGTLTLTGGSSNMTGGLVVEQGTVVLQTAGSFPGTGYYGTNLGVLKGATLSTNASYALSYTQNVYVLGGTFSYLSGDIYSPNLILDGGTVANATAGGTTGGFRFGYNADGYVNVLSGLGASTLSGKFQLFGNGKTEFFRVSDGAAARDLVISGNLADDPSYTGLRITKNGLGTMAFTGASSRSGGTTINAGVLEVAAANALGTGATAGITLGGGTLLINYAAGGSHNTMAANFGGGTLSLSGNTSAVTQGIGAVGIANGSAIISVAPGAGGTTTVNLGAITRSGTATRAFLDLSGTATWTTTQANDATKGRLLGVLLNGGLAMNNGSNTIVAYTGTQISGTTISAGATTDYTIGSSVTGDLSMAASGVTSIQSLTLDSTVGRTVNIGASNTLRVAEGIFQRSSAYALNFGASGTLTAGSADNTAADLAIIANGGMLTGTAMSVGSVIADNGTGAVTLVKGGAGSLAITGTNTYSGGTLIQQGRLVVAGSANVGSGTITVSDGGQLYATGAISNTLTLNGGSGIDDGGGRGNLGALRIENGVTLSGAVTVNNDSQVTTYGGAAATLSGTVTLNGELVKTGSGTLTLSGTVNNGNGTLYVKEGTVVFSTDYVYKYADIFIGAGATVSHTGTNAFQGNMLTIAGGTYTTSSYHGKLTNVTMYGGNLVGTGSGKYAGQDANFGTADTTLFVGGSAMSRITTPNKFGLNNTRVYVQDATGNSAPDLLVRGAFDGTGYFAGLGTTRFARQALSTGANSNHTATTYIQQGHTLEVASDGSMGTGTIVMDGGILRMTSLAGLAEYQLTGTSSLDSTNAGTLIGVTMDNQHLNDSSSGTFGGNTTWSYRGKLVITDASRTIKFSENIDDAAWVKVSGTANNGTVVNSVVLNDATWNANTTNSITLTTGTYDIDVRGQNGGGGYGPVSGLNGNGIAWDINNGTNWTSIGVTTDTGVQVYASGNVSQTLANTINFSRVSDVEVLGATDTVTLTGVIGGAGMLNKTGAGALVLSNSGNTISGGITVTGGELRVASAGALGTGSVNLLSGSTLTYSGASNVTFSNAIIAERGDAAISVWTSGTTLTLSQGIDNYSSGAAQRTIAKQGAGTLEVAGLLTGNHLYDIQGGVLVISATDASRASATVGAGTTLTVSSAGTFGAITNAGTATANSATTLGALTNTAGTLSATSATTVGNLNVSGGTLGIGSATTLGTVTVSGGTLNAASATTAGTLSVSGGTTNLGAGSYGATTLSNGTLNVGAATLASLNKTGGTLNIGAVGTAATLTATGNSVLGGMLNFDLSNSTSSGNDKLVFGGTVNLSGLTGVTFNLTSGALSTGSYTLLTSAGITNPTIGIGSVTKSGIASGASRQTYTLSTGTIANALTLDVAGAVGTNTFATGGNDVWSVNSTDGAWTSTATDQWFYNGDLVTFADLAATSAKTVTISGDVSPGSTAFTNSSATTFTLSGTGKITGTTGLTKSGNGRLILSNTGGNNYTGATTVSNGTLELGNSTALSAVSAVTVSGTGTLDVAAVANVAAGSVTLNAGTITGTTGSLNASSLIVNGGSLAANVAGSGTLTFAGTGLTYAKTATHTGGTNLSSGSLTVASGGSIAGAFTQSANTTLTVAGSLGGALSIATGSTTTVSAGGSVGGNVTAVGNAALTNAGTITGALSLANTSTAANSGTISGGFTLANTATLTSTGAIAGGGTIVAGTSLNTSGTLAGNIANAGTLTFSGTTDRSYAGIISGSSAVYKTGSSTLTMSGGSASSGHTIANLYLQGGRIVLNTGSGATWNNTLNYANITLSGGTTLQISNSTSFNGNLNITGGTSGSPVEAVIEVDAGRTAYKDTAGTLGGSTTYATLRKTGAGTLQIGTNNMAFGTGTAVIVDAGTLAFNKNNWYSGNVMGSASLTINSGGTVDVMGYHTFDAFSNYTVTINGGRLTSSNGNGFYLGTLNMTGGTVDPANIANLSAINTFASASTATINCNLGIYDRGFTATVADGAAAVDLQISSTSQGFTKAGAGLMRVAGAASVAATVNAGTLEVGNGATSGSIVGVTINNAAVVQFNRSDAVTYASIASGTGSLAQVGSGKLTLSGANSFSGGLYLNGGTVALTNATAGGTAGITAANNATLEVSTGITAAHTTLGGAGSLTKTGAGSLTISGANTLAGNLAVSAGSLSLTGAGSLGNGGTVSVGSGATLALGGSVSDSQTGLITNAGTLTNAGVTARAVSNSSIFANTGTAGALTLTAGTASNTGTLGAVSQSGGTLTSTGAVGAVSSTSGTLNLSGNAGAVSLGGASVLSIAGANVTGALAASSLTIVDGSVLDFELSEAAGQFYDRLTLTGALDLSSVTNPVTLNLFSFDRVLGSRGAATVFNRYADFTLDIITAGSISGSTEISDPLGGTSTPVLNLNVSNFTYLVNGVATAANSADWSLVATSGGYQLKYVADIAKIDINVGSGLLETMSENADGQGFLASLAANELGRVLRKTGSGQLTVSEALTHVGGTQVTAGSLLLASGGSLGPGDIAIASGATLKLAVSGTLDNTLSGAGDIQKTGAGDLELTGTVATTGNVSIQQGKLAANFAALTGTVEVLSGATAEFKGASGLTFSGQLAGAGAARLASGNTLTLGATSNGFSGTFSVANGTLVLAADNALGTGTADIAAGSTVTVSGGRTLASAFTGAGALTKTGAGTATLTGAVGHTGATTVSNGTLKGDFTNASGAIGVASGATLEYAIASDATRAGSDITGLGSFTKSGNGALTLGSALGVTGGVSIAAGTLAAADFGTSSTVTIGSGANARLDLASSTTLATVFAGSGTFTKTGNSTLTVGGTGLSTFTGKVRATQGVISTAATANLGSGAIELDGASLAVTASGQTLGSGRALIVGGNGATINTSSLGQTGSLTVDSLISGSGALTLAASGNTSASGSGDGGVGIRLTNASNSFTGDITVTSGLVNYASNAVFGNAANKIVLNGGGLLDTGYNATLARNVEVQSGGGIIRFYGSTAATWSGSLSGSGALSRTDGGTLTHTGDLSGFTGTLNNLSNSVTLFTGASAGFGVATVNITSSAVGFAAGRMGSATVNLDGGTLRFESSGSQSGSVKLVSGKTGYVNTNGNNVTLTNGITGTGATLEKSTGSGTLTLQGSGTATLTSGLNAYAGTLELAGQSLATPQVWIHNGGALKVSSGTLDVSTYLLMGNGTMEITGGTINAPLFRTSDGSGYVSTVNQSGGTMNVTGSVISNGTGNSFLLNHWSGTSTYNLSGGTLNVLNTTANIGWDGSAYFNQSGGTFNTRGINLGDGRNNTGAYNLTGGRLNIGTSGITAASAKPFTAGDATLGAYANWTGASSIAVSSGKTLTIDTQDSVDGTTGRTITLSGGLTGAGSVTKVGNGTLTLSGASTLSGAVAVNGGTLNINATTQSISGLTVGSGATVAFGVNNALAAGHGTYVTQAMTVNGGTVSFGSGTEMRIGNVNLNGGTLTFNRGIDAWDILLADTASSTAATITVGGSSASAMNGPGGLHISGVQNFNVGNATGDAAADLVVSAKLGNAGTNLANAAGGINKTGAGTMTLTNADNSFTGAITVGAGTLEVGGGGRLNGGSYSAGITNNGTLVFSSAANQTLSGAITGTGSLTKSGNGTLTLAATNTYAGATAVNGGTLVLTSANAISSLSEITIGAAGTLSLSYAQGADTTLSRAFLGTGLLDLATTGGYTTTLTGLTNFGGSVRLGTGVVFDAVTSGWNGGLVFAGGSLYAASLSNYTGTVTVAAGTTLDASVGLPSNVVLQAGATIDFTGASEDTLKNATIQFAGGSLTNAQNFTGNLVVTGSNVSIAPGSIGGGTLVVGTGSSVNITGALSNSINVSGGSIQNGQNLTGEIVVTSGTFTIGAGSGTPGIDTLNANATVKVSGATLDLGGNGVTNTISFTSGSITNGENFGGTVNVESGGLLTNTGTLGGSVVIKDSAKFSNNGVLTGAVTVENGGTLGGSGTFAGATIQQGATLAPGNSPGIMTYTSNLVLLGGSTWQEQIYAWTPDGTLPNGDANGNHVGARAYDTVSLSLDALGLGGYVTLDLTDATSLNQITLKLMTLASWSANSGSTPTALDLSVQRDFVIASYMGNASLAGGETISSIFRFDASGFYFPDGRQANSSNFLISEIVNAQGVTELTLSVVPEPSTYGLMLGGLALAAAAYRRRRQAKA